MMILRSSPASPFGRKVRIAISLLGFTDQTKIEPADPTDSSDSLRRQNPLGKIPALIDDDGTAYYDSRVILEFLDERASGGKIVPRRGGDSPPCGCRRCATAFSMRRF
ncbi:MAG: glutathione S-transferase N-terminal domain-containing protein [Xanthobacteraceae bacterium]